MAASPTARFPLREEKRRQTRAAILVAARLLFARDGYAKATMAHIADEAGLHVQTLYRHFPTKQGMAAALSAGQLRRALAKRTTDTLTFWKEWTRTTGVAAVSRDGGAALLQFQSKRVTDPRLDGVVAEMGTAYVEVLTDALAADLALDRTEDRLPSLIAWMMWGGNVDAFDRWAAGSELQLAELMGQAADEVRDMATYLIQRGRPPVPE